MKSPAWRIVAFVDLGIDAGRRVAVDPKSPDAWLREVGARVSLKLAGGAGAPRPVELELDGRRAFEAGVIAERLGPAEGRAALLDLVLHDPAFQRAESAWRGVHFLAEQAGKAVEVEIVACPRGTLARRFQELIHDPVMAGDAEAPALVLLDFDFSHQTADLALLQELAALAAAIPCPLVGAAAPALFGMRYWAHVAGIADVTGAWMDAGHAPWREFQASDPARWVALTMNRYLQRVPAAVEGSGYQERVDEARPETFLWGRGIWLVGAAAARSIREHGHALDIAGRGGIFSGMPSREYPHMGDPVALAVETPLPEMKASELAWAGLTPLVGVLRRDAVVLSMVVTLFRLKPGRLTIEGTLAYQITAARIAQSLNAILPRLPRDAEGAMGYLQAELAEALGPVLGANAAAGVQVGLGGGAAATEGAAGPGLLEVRVRPAMPLEGKEAEFVYQLPWHGL